MFYSTRRPPTQCHTLARTHPRVESCTRWPSSFLNPSPPRVFPIQLNSHQIGLFSIERPGKKEKGKIICTGLRRHFLYESRKVIEISFLHFFVPINGSHSYAQGFFWNSSYKRNDVRYALFCLKWLILADFGRSSRFFSRCIVAVTT